MSFSKLVPLFAVLLLAAVACASGPSRETSVANLTRGDNALTDEQANCVVDTVGEDSLEAYDNFSGTYQEEFEAQTDAGTPDADAQALLDAVLECAFPELGSALDDLESGVADLGSEFEEGLADAQSDAAAAAGAAAGALDDEPVDCSTVDGACDYGDDPTLDALWDGCEAGDGQACDDLFFDSPLGSRYEEFGNTCGGRGFEVSCAEVYSN